METFALVIDAPGQASLSRQALSDVSGRDVLVDVAWTGVSAGTERLLWSGRMPDFPGMGYPLVPGYESVGCVIAKGPEAKTPVGSAVFVPGAQCFRDARCLFGGTASQLVAGEDRIVTIEEDWGDQATLLALAATAHHAIAPDGKIEAVTAPQLIVGHGVLGRLMARLLTQAGSSPVVWEVNPTRATGADGYAVIHPDTDDRRDYRVICDVSGHVSLLDGLIGRLAPGGEVVLAGFYDAPVSFAFPPAFMKEARLRVAAQWAPRDLIAVRDLAASGALSLDGLISHRRDAAEAANAYGDAFADPDCLKLVLDWRDVS